jgi:hypothetical protein
MNADLERAIDTARQHIPIQKMVSKPEFWCGFTICITERGEYRVYSADAWDEPTERPMLPWSAPTARPIGHVDMNGTYTEIGVEK